MTPFVYTFSTLILILIQITGNASNDFSKNESETKLSSDRITDMLLQNTCSYQGRCDQNEGMGIPVCYCDEACHAFNDCCLEVIQHSNVKNLNNELQSKIPFVSCQRSQIMTELGYLSGNYFISKCPEDFPFQDVFRKCDNGGVFPVHTKDGITYKNVYCAYCHGNRDYTVWEFHFTYRGACNIDAMAALNASNTSSKIKFIQNKGCKYYFMPLSFKDLRSCYIYTETETNDTLKQYLCEQFANAVLVYDKTDPAGKYYRNIFCLETTKDKNINCQPALSLPTDHKGMETTALTGIFNVRPVIEVSGQRICNEDEYYSDVSDSCVAKYCRSTDGTNDKCTIELMKNFPWKTKKVSLITDDVVDVNLILRAQTFFYLSLPREKYDLSAVHSEGKFVCAKSSTYAGGGCCIFDGFAIFAIQNVQTQKNIDNFILKAERIGWKYKEFFQGKTVTTRHIDNININTTCIIKGTKITDETVFNSKYRYNFQKKLFVYDDSNRSKFEVPIYFEGTAVSNDIGLGEIAVKIKRWEYRYSSDGGAASGTLTLIQWPSSAFMIFITNAYFLTANHG